MLTVLLTAPAGAVTGRAVQDRLDGDIEAGRPVVVHVVVALCDNAHQGIVPVPEALGNGQAPRTNLYWGARYGVRTFFSRVAGWVSMETETLPQRHILDRVILYSELERGDGRVPVYVVADAWDGAHIREALQAYLAMTAGRSLEVIEVAHESERVELHAGGSSHLLAYVGHNGLMDFSLDSSSLPVEGSKARSAVVLACASRSFFLDRLQEAGAHPLLLTTGLMAPEAYTLDSAIRSWVGRRTTEAVLDAAAVAYDAYQRCGLRGARRLFWGAP